MDKSILRTGKVNKCIEGRGGRLSRIKFPGGYLKYLLFIYLAWEMDFKVWKRGMEDGGGGGGGGGGRVSSFESKVLRGQVEIPTTTSLCYYFFT